MASKDKSSDETTARASKWNLTSTTGVVIVTGNAKVGRVIGGTTYTDDDDQD